MFSCSLGAICATLYLINDGQQTPVRAATFYSTPLNPLENLLFFSNVMFGLYNWALVHSLTQKLAPLFPDIYKFSTKE
jgi:predicted alpha/beta-fold hydrolase